MNNKPTNLCEIVVGSTAGMGSMSAPVREQLPHSRTIGALKARAAVHAATGNLCFSTKPISVQDLGVDWSLGFVYNSLSKSQWRKANFDDVGAVTGAVNTVNSTVVFNREDGAPITYTYDATRKTYTYLDANQGLLTLTYQADKTWRHANALTGITKKYDAKGRLVARSDKNANQTIITYSDTQTIIKLPSGQQVYYVKTAAGYSIYTADPMTVDPIQTVAMDANQRITNHTYSSATDNSSYQINYTYDSATGFLEAATQSDQSSLSFAYDANHRVSAVQDGEGRTDSPTYADGQCVLTNSLGRATTYALDADHQLASVTLPGNEKTSFSYDAATHLLDALTQPNQTAQAYQYDANGYVIARSHQAAGAAGIQQTVKYVKDANGRVQNKIILSDVSNPASAMVQRVVYDAKGNRAFDISATGDVTQHDYDNLGKRIASRTFLAAAYDLSILKTTDPLSLAQLTTWSATQSKAQVSLRTFTYWPNGQHEATRHFNAVDSSGNGILNDQTEWMTQAWDAYGHELICQTSFPSAVATTGHDYDAIGRVTKLTELDDDYQTTWQYDDAHAAVIKTKPTHLSERSTYDKGGLLDQFDQKNRAGDLRTTSYHRDKAGQLFKTTLPTGQSTYQLFNTDGQLAYQIDQLGFVKSVAYDVNGHHQSETCYATVIDVTTLQPGQTTLAVTASDNDRTSYTVYNALNQLQYKINAIGGVTQYSYDDAGRKIQAVAYHTQLTAAQIQALIAGTTTPTSDPDDRAQYFHYLPTGQLDVHQDASGYLTKFSYDHAGREAQSIRYATPTAAKNFTPVPDSAHDAYHYTFYDGANKIGEINAEGAVTQYTHDQSGRVKTKCTFITTVTVPTTKAFADLLPASNPEDAVETYYYDVLGRLTTTSYSNGSAHHKGYNSDNQVEGDWKSDLSDTVTRGWGYQYNDFGEQILKTNPRDGIAGDEYDPGTGLHLSSIDVLQHQTIFYYDQKQQLVASVDAEGCVKQFTYNAFGEQSEKRTLINKLTADQVESLKGGFITTAITTLLTAAQSDNDIVEKIAFNKIGKAETNTDGEGYQTTYGYNAFGERSGKTQQVDKTGKTLQHAYNHHKNGLLQTHIVTGTDGTTKITQDSFTYNAQGKVVSHTDAVDAKTTYERDRLGRELLKTDALTHEVGTTWDALNRPKTRTDALKQVTEYGYTQATRTTVKTLPSKATVTTVNNVFGQEETVIDENGVTTTKTYEKGGNLESERVEDEVKNQYTYQLDGSTKEHTDAKQLVTAYGYDGSGQMTTVTTDPDGKQQVLKQQFDGAGRVTTQTDEAGIVSTLGYDRNHNVIQKVVDIATLKHTTVQAYDGLHQLTNKTVSDVNTPTAFVASVAIDLFARLSAHTKDPDGLNIVTQHLLNAAGQMIAEIDGEGQKTYLVRNIIGQLRYKLNPAGGTTEYFYDANRRSIKEVQYTNAISLDSFATKSPTIDAVSALIKADPTDVTTYKIHDVDGHLVYQLNADGCVTAYVNDQKGKPIQTYEYANTIDLKNISSLTPSAIAAAVKPSGKDRMTCRFYNKQGQVQYHINAKGAVTAYAYTAMGQITDEWRYDTKITLASVKPSSTLTQIKALIKTSEQDRHTQTLYDTFGNERYQLRYQDATSVLVGEFQYDMRNTLAETRRYQKALTLPSVVTIDNVTTAITTQKIADDVHDLHRVYTYDGLRRKSAVKTCPNNTDLNYNEQWKLDAKNHTLTHTDRLKQAWDYGYDGAGRKTKSLTPEVETAGLELNADKTQYQLTTPQSARIATDFTYSKTDKLLTQTFAAGTAQAHTKTMKRDVLGNVSSVSQNLPVDSSTSVITALGDRPDAIETITEVYVYDAHGRKIIEPNKTNAADIVVYNSLGKKAYEIDHAGTVTHYSYNTFKQLSSVRRYAMRITLTDAMFTKGIGWATLQGLIKTSLTDRSLTFAYDLCGKKILQQESARWMAHSEGGELQLKQATPTKTWAYNSFGELFVESTQVSPDGKVTADIVHRYDNMGYEVATIDERNHLDINAHNPSGQVISHMEYTNPLPASANPQTDTISALEKSITISAQDRKVNTAYNALGYKTETAKLNVITDAVSETKDGSPTITIQAAKDLITKYSPDALGRVLETQYPATDGQAAPTEKATYNALNKKTKVVHASRASGYGLGAKTLTPVTDYGYNVHAYQVSKTDYQDSTNGKGIVDDTNRQELTLSDLQGRALLKQDAEGFWHQMSYKACGLLARKWKFLTHWTESNDKTLVLAQIQYAYNSTGSTNEMTVHDGVQTYTEYKGYNAFGEWVEKGFSDSSAGMPVKRSMDNTGQCWRSNEKNGVPEITITDGAGKDVLTLRSGIQDLMQVNQENIAILAAEPMASVQQTICERELDGQVATQQLPSLTQPKSLPLHLEINTGPDKAFGVYAMTWDAPPLSSTEMKLTLWPKGSDESAKQVFHPTIKNNRAGVDVSKLIADQYNFEIECFYKDPQTKVIDSKPYRSGGGVVPLATKNTKGSKNTMVMSEGGNKLLIAGKDPGWVGIALVKNNAIISRHAINRLAGKQPFVDLSQEDIGHYQVYAFEKWALPTAVDASSVKIDWRDLMIKPGTPTGGWLPKSNPAYSPGMTDHVEFTAFPPQETGTELVVQAEYINCYEVQGHSFQCSQNKYSKLEVGRSYLFVQPSQDAQQVSDGKSSGAFSSAALSNPLFPIGWYSGPLRVACYLTDAQQKLWFVGLMANAQEPELTDQHSPRGYVSGLNTGTTDTVVYGASVGNSTLQLMPWMSNYAVIDGSQLTSTERAKVTFHELPDSITGLTPVGSVAVSNAVLTDRVQHAVMELTDVSFVNNHTESLPSWSIKFTAEPAFVKEHAVMFTAKSTTQGEPVIPAYGPNHPYSNYPECPTGHVLYDPGAPVTASVGLFNYPKSSVFKEIPIIKNAIPKNEGSSHYSLPDGRVLYINIPSSVIEQVLSAQVEYFDTTLGLNGEWVSLGDLSFLNEGAGEVNVGQGIAVPLSDVDPGRYAYRFKVFGSPKVGNKPIDLSKVATVDAKGYVNDVFVAGGEFATYTNKMPATQVITPKREQKTDRWKHVTKRTNELGHNTSHAYRAFASHPHTTTHPEIAVTDEMGKTTTINPVEHQYLDEHNQVIGHADANDHLIVHYRNAVGQATRTLGADGVYKNQTINGFGNVEAITSALPDGTASTIKQAFDRRGLMVSKTDALDWQEKYEHDVLGNQISKTDAKDNVFHTHYNLMKKLLMSRLPLGQTTIYTYNEHQTVATQVSANKDGSDKKLLSWTYDNFGNKATQIDLGGVKTTYTRNHNKQITDEEGVDTGVKKQPHGVRYINDQKDTVPVPMNKLHHEFNEAGFEISVEDEAMNQTTRYLIAADGQRESEWFENSDGTVEQGVSRHRNAMGWMDRIDDLRYFMQRLFDAHGNIRAVKVSYFNEGEITPLPELDEWFTYNEANEMLIMKGDLKDGKIQLANGKGTQLTYKAGFRVQENQLKNDGTSVVNKINYQRNELIAGVDGTDSLQRFGFDKTRVRTSYQYTEIIPAHFQPLPPSLGIFSRIKYAAHRGVASLSGRLAERCSRASERRTSPKTKRSSVLGRFLGRMAHRLSRVSARHATRAHYIAGAEPGLEMKTASDFSTVDDQTKTHNATLAVNENRWVLEQTHTDSTGLLTDDDKFSNFGSTGLSLHQENQMPQQDGQWLHDALDQTNNLFMEEEPAEVKGTRTMSNGGNAPTASLTCTQTANGHTESVQGHLADSFRYFIVNHEGRIVLKRTGVKGGATEYYFYDPQGRIIGRAGNLPPEFDEVSGKPKDINFTMNDLPIGENWPPALGVDSYQALFDGQETFPSIAKNVYADESFADLLAFNRGYNATDSVPSEMQIPLLIMQATINRNWQGDYPNYDAAKIIGALYPKIPIPVYVPPHLHHNIWGDVLAMAFVVAVGILAPEAMGALLTAGMSFLETVMVDVAIGAVSAAASDLGSQEIERLAHNQKGISDDELGRAVLGGAIGGLAAGLNGVSYVSQAAATLSWHSVEVQVRVVLLQAALNEAVHGGKVDWKGVVLNATNAVMSAGVGKMFGASPSDTPAVVMSSMTTSVLSDMARDALYHDKTADWRIVGNAVGTGLGTAIGQSVVNEINERRIDALAMQAKAIQRQNDTLNGLNAATQADWSSMVAGGDWGQLGQPHNSLEQSDPFHRDGGGIFGKQPAANEPYGTSTHQPMAESSRPNMAVRHNQAVTSNTQIQQQLNNRIREQAMEQQANRAARKAGWFDRAWHDAERGLSTAYHRTASGYDRFNDDLIEFDDNHPYAAASINGVSNAVNLASMFFDGGASTETALASVSDTLVGAGRQLGGYARDAFAQGKSLMFRSASRGASLTEEYSFKAGEDLIHFEKHGARIANKIGPSVGYAVEQYVADANRVIKEGVYVPELNAYVKVPTGLGEAQATFVGVDRFANKITTFHLKPVRFLEQRAPSLGWQAQTREEITDLIGPDREFGWQPPYGGMNP